MKLFGQKSPLELPPKEGSNNTPKKLVTEKFCWKTHQTLFERYIPIEAPQTSFWGLEG